MVSLSSSYPGIEKIQPFWLTFINGHTGLVAEQRFGQGNVHLLGMLKGYEAGLRHRGHISMDHAINDGLLCFFTGLKRLHLRFIEQLFGEFNRDGLSNNGNDYAFLIELFKLLDVLCLLDIRRQRNAGIRIRSGKVTRNALAGVIAMPAIMTSISRLSKAGIIFSH